MKVKRILSLILSLTLMLAGCISVSPAEEPEAEEPLESDNELSVIMEEEIEIVQAEALLGAAPEEEPEKPPSMTRREGIRQLPGICWNSLKSARSSGTPCGQDFFSI